jgi:hypothetical protein
MTRRVDGSFLVNPPQPTLQAAGRCTALYHNNDDGSFTGVTENGVECGTLQSGCNIRVSTMMDIPILSDRLHGAILYHNNGSGTHRRHSKARVADEADGRPAPDGSITTRTAPRSPGFQLHRVVVKNNLGGRTSSRLLFLRHPSSYKDRDLLYHNTTTAPSPT